MLAYQQKQLVSLSEMVSCLRSLASKLSRFQRSVCEQMYDVIRGQFFWKTQYKLQTFRKAHLTSLDVKFSPTLSRSILNKHSAPLALGCSGSVP